MKIILVIEDEKLLQEAYHKKLTMEGYNVVQAFTGQEGLDALQTQTPDLIILDIILPGGKDGISVLEEIKRNETWKHIPVLMLTNLESQTESAKKLGVTEYIIKADTPIDDIVERIQKITG